MLLALRILSGSISVCRSYRDYIVVVTELASFGAESEVANSW